MRLSYAASNATSDIEQSAWHAGMTAYLSGIQQRQVAHALSDNIPALFLSLAAIQ